MFQFHVSCTLRLRRLFFFTTKYHHILRHCSVFCFLNSCILNVWKPFLFTLCVINSFFTNNRRAHTKKSHHHHHQQFCLKQGLCNPHTNRGIKNSIVFVNLCESSCSLKQKVLAGVNVWWDQSWRNIQQNKIVYLSVQLEIFHNQ